MGREKGSILCEVDVEEIDVQACLDDACSYCDRVNDVVRGVSASTPRVSDQCVSCTGGDAPVYPVGDIERAVGTKGGEVVRGYRLGLACPLQHEELREDRDRLEEDGKGPQNLGEVEVVVEHEG